MAEGLPDECFDSSEQPAKLVPTSQKRPLWASQFIDDMADESNDEDEEEEDGMDEQQPDVRKYLSRWGMDAKAMIKVLMTELAAVRAGYNAVHPDMKGKRLKF